MSFKIITKHPVGTRMFKTRSAAVKMALGMRLANPANVADIIAETGPVLVRPRMGD